MKAKFLVMLLSLSAIADIVPPFTRITPRPELQKVALDGSYVPMGFDDNDRLQFVVKGKFPNSCYRIGPYDIRVNDVMKKIVITQRAYYYSEGVCILLEIPFTQTIQVGILPKGTYSLVDGKSGATLGKATVTQATNKGPDDYLYAPVSDANIVPLGSGQNNLVLSGNFTDRCSSFEDVKVIVNDRVIVVQPIIRRDTSMTCPSELTRFQKVVPLDSSIKGVYLLHVRSLDGQAINKMVTVD